MRVYLVTWNYPPKVGGMETLLAELMANLRQHADVCVFGPATAEERKTDSNTIRAGRPGLFWFMFEAFFRSLSELHNGSYDVIVAGSVLVVPIAFFLSRLFHLPVVTNVYGLDVIYPHPIYQWMVRLFLPRCHRLIAISEAAKNAAMERGVEPGLIEVIHPGIRFSEFEQPLDQASLKETFNFANRPVLLSAGRLAKRKGVVEFIQYSLPTIVEHRPDVVLVVAGGNPLHALSHKDDIKSQIEDLVCSSGLESNVCLMGRVERNELIKLFHACDLFILPAIPVPGDMEGFGIVLIEAAAAGKAVISTALGGIPDAVVNGSSGILVEAGEWDNFATAVIDLLDKPSLREKMGSFGRERARSVLDWQVVGQKYFECLASTSNSQD